MVLFNILCHADRQKLTMALAHRGSAPMADRLPPDVEVFDYLAQGNYYFGLARRAYHRLRVKQDRAPDNLRLKRIHEQFKPDLWYINAITQPEVLRQARKYGIPCVLHSHELEPMFHYVSVEDLGTLIEYPRLIIACSEAVEQVYRRLGRRGAIEVCYGMIDVSRVKADEARTRALRQELGVSDGAFVWLMSGTLTPNKNPVLFVEILNELLQKGHNTHFIWLGGGESGYSQYAKAKAVDLGVAERIAWMGVRDEDYYDYFNAADGFVLTSKRDSFPLVLIEAAALGKPIVSLDSGGVREFVLSKMGKVVSDSHGGESLVEAMERVMMNDMVFDPSVSRERAREFDVSVRARTWERIMSSHFPTNNGSG